MVNKKDVATCFGAALMRDPEHVGECLRRMREAVNVPVTVKHRLGVRPTEKSADDSMDSYAFVSDFVDVVNQSSGVEHFIVHARAAVLSGLSTTGNRTVPPLRHREVHALADDFPRLGFTINGGVESLDQAAEHLESGKLRGVMLGRAAYRNPALLAEVDARFYGDEPREAFRERYAGEARVAGRWDADGFRLASDDRVPSRDSGGTRTEDDRLGSRGSFFALDGTDTTAVCVTRRDVLERYAAYGDAVCAMNVHAVARFPNALLTPRRLAKAVLGLGHGARGGGGFRRACEREFGEWTRRLRAGEPPETLSFSDLVRGAASEMDAADLDAPLASCATARAHGEARYGRRAGGGGREDGAEEGNARASASGSE